MQRASRIIQAVLAEDEGGEHEQLEVAPEGQQRQVAADEASESEITLAAGEATTARSAAGVALSGIELPGERTPVPPPRPQQGEAGDTAQMHQMQAPAAYDISGVLQRKVEVNPEDKAAFMVQALADFQQGSEADKLVLFQTALYDALHNTSADQCAALKIQCQELEKALAEARRELQVQCQEREKAIAEARREREDAVRFEESLRTPGPSELSLGERLAQLAPHSEEDRLSAAGEDTASTVSNNERLADTAAAEAIVKRILQDTPDALAGVEENWQTSHTKLEKKEHLEEVRNLAMEAAKFEGADKHKFLRLQPVPKAADKGAVFDAVATLTKDIIKDGRNMANPEDLFSKVADIIMKANTGRDLLAVVCRNCETTTQAYMVYVRLYEATKLDPQIEEKALEKGTSVSLQQWRQDNMLYDQQILFRIVENGPARHSKSLHRELFERHPDGGIGPYQSMEHSALGGWSFLLAAQKAFGSAHWSGVIKAFDELWLQKDLIDIRYHGYLEGATKEVAKAIQKFESKYGTLDADLFRRIISLNMLYGASAKHLGRIRVKLEEDRIITNESINWRRASSEIHHLITAAIDRERSDPSKEVKKIKETTTYLSLPECRKKLDDKRKAGSNADDVKEMAHLAFEAGKVDAAAKVAGAFFTQSKDPVCPNCHTRHQKVDGPCPVQQQRKRLEENATQLGRIFADMDNMLRKVIDQPDSAGGVKGDLEKLQQGVKGIKEALSAPNRGRGGAGASGRGRSQTRGGKPGDKGPRRSPSSSGDKHCFQWQREGKCRLGDKCQYTHDPVKAGTNPQAGANFRKKKKDADGDSAPKEKPTACVASTPEAKPGDEDDDLESFFDTANAAAAALIQNPDYVKLEGGTHENARQVCNVALAGIIGVGKSAYAEPASNVQLASEEVSDSEMRLAFADVLGIALDDQELELANYKKHASFREKMDLLSISCQIEVADVWQHILAQRHRVETQRLEREAEAKIQQARAQFEALWFSDASEVSTALAREATSTTSQAGVSVEVRTGTSTSTETWADKVRKQIVCAESVAVPGRIISPVSEQRDGQAGIDCKIKVLSPTIVPNDELERIRDIANSLQQELEDARLAAQVAAEQEGWHMLPCSEEDIEWFMSDQREADNPPDTRKPGIYQEQWEHYKAERVRKQEAALAHEARMQQQSEAGIQKRREKAERKAAMEAAEARLHTWSRLASRMLYRTKSQTKRWVRISNRTETREMVQDILYDLIEDATMSEADRRLKRDMEESRKVKEHNEADLRERRAEKSKTSDYLSMSSFPHVPKVLRVPFARAVTSKGKRSLAREAQRAHTIQRIMGFAHTESGDRAWERFLQRYATDIQNGHETPTITAWFRAVTHYTLRMLVREAIAAHRCARLNRAATAYSQYGSNDTIIQAMDAIKEAMVTGIASTKTSTEDPPNDARDDSDNDATAVLDSNSEEGADSSDAESNEISGAVRIATAEHIPSIYPLGKGEEPDVRKLRRKGRGTRWNVAKKDDMLQEKVLVQAPQYVHPYSTLALTEVYRLFEFDPEEQAYVSVHPAVLIKEFLSCYRVDAGPRLRNLVLWLVDSGASVFLSSLERHFYMKIKCEQPISGLGGDALAESYTLLVLSVTPLDEDEGYIVMQNAKLYEVSADRLPFPLASTPQLERLGYAFHLQEINPYFESPTGRRGPLIKDHVTGLTWLPERIQAEPTVNGKLKTLEIYRSMPEHIKSKVSTHPERVGAVQEKPKFPDTKEKIDKEFTSVQLASVGYHSGSAKEHLGVKKTGVAAAEQVCRAGYGSKDGRAGSNDEACYAGKSKTKQLVDEAARNLDQPRAAKPGLVVPEPLLEPRDDMEWSSDSEDADKTPADAPKESGVNDDIVYHDEDEITARKVQAAARTRPMKLKIPATKFLDTGQPEEVQKLRQYVHWLLGHLSASTITKSLPYLDGAEMLRAIEFLFGQEDPSHCSACAEFKSRNSAKPGARCTRPTVEDRVTSLYVDICGPLRHASVYHKFIYYMHAVTDIGYQLVEGLHFKNQSLLVLGKIYSDLGGAPLKTVVDGAGELSTSKVAKLFYAHHNTQKVGTMSGMQWQNGRSERRHGVINNMTAASMAQAGAPSDFWWFCLQHMVLICNLVLVARDPETRKSLKKTVWEAHFGVRPRLQDFLLAPWGCMCYLILTQDQRKSQDQDWAFGARAIGGIYLGAWCNPKSLVFQHLMTDGKTIFATAHNLKCVGDAFPFRWQRGRDVKLKLEDDGAESPDDEEADSYVAIVKNAEREQVRSFRQELCFTGSVSDKQAQKQRERMTKATGVGKRKIFRSLANRSNSDKDRTVEEYEQILAEQVETNAHVELENPADFEFEPAPSNLQLVKPYDGARYEVAVPIDFSSGVGVPVEITHPHQRYIGRRVRRDITAKQGGVSRRSDKSNTMTGTVTSYSPHRALFRIDYDPPAGGWGKKDAIWEERDFQELSEILIMGVKYGDDKKHAGKTRAEITDMLQEKVLVQVAYWELIHNRVPERSGHVRWHPNENALTEVWELENDARDSGERAEYASDNLRLDKRPAKVDSASENSGEETTSRSAMRAYTVVESNSAHSGEEPTEYETPVYDDEPRNWAEVRKHKQVEQIIEAALKEMKQLKDMNVAVYPSEEELAEIRKRGTKILRTKMVYKRKYESIVGRDGIARDRFLKWKARLAVVGSSEVKAVDLCWSTFSPTIGMTAVRTIISLMCDPKYDVRSYDLSGAFLATPLDRAVYVKLPEDAGEDAGKILRLIKACYGLKSSGRDFVSALSKKILEFEHEGCKFHRLYMDHCIYIFIGPNGEEIVLCHYVDDIICGTNNPELREKFLEHLRTQWNITDEGVLSRFLGINFYRSEDGTTWEMRMGAYIDKIVERFGERDTRRAPVPMDPGFTLTPEDIKEEPTVDMIKEYRSLIGSIGFAAISCRFDISYAVSTLSRHLMRPNKKVIHEARRVVRYLRDTRDFCIRWSSSHEYVAEEMHNVAWGAVDASYAACPLTRRSHGGWLVFMNGGAISWKSGLQPLVTMSSCEAEFVSLCNLILEVRYIRMLLEELGHTQGDSTLIWEDNKATILIAEGESSSAGRAKHIDVRFKKVAESVRDGTVRVRYVPTDWNYADIMTKPLMEVKFKRCRDMCVTPRTGDKDRSVDVDENASAFMLIFDHTS